MSKSIIQQKRILTKGGGSSISVPVSPANGGTGISSYSIGDLLYASGATTLSKLADVAIGSVLVSGGVGVAPSWSNAPVIGSAINLGISSSSTGSIVYKNSTNANTLTINSGVTSASYTLTLPTAQGGASTFLQNNGSGVLSWTTASSGITVGTTTITSGTSLRIPYNLSGVYQEQANFTIGSVATGVLDVPIGYASRGVKFANQYDTGLNLTVGYLSGLGATVTNNTFDANTAYNTLVGIGAGSAISGSFASGNTAFGYEALKASGGAGNPEVYNNTAIGFRALGTYAAGTGYNVALGYRAGYGTGSTLRYATFLGYSAGDGTAFNSVIAIGANTFPTAANQCIIGATGAASGNGVIDNVYFNGVTHTSAAGVTINSCGGSGTNNAGASLTISGGKGTGTAASGDIKHQTSVKGASGTTLQTLGDRYSIVGKYVDLTAATATAFGRVTIPSNTTAGGLIIVSVEANDGTDYQNRTFYVSWAAANKAGTTTVTLNTVHEVVASTSGTLTGTITIVDSGSGNVDFKMDASSSLAETTLRASFQLFKNFGTGTISAS